MWVNVSLRCGRLIVNAGKDGERSVGSCHPRGLELKACNSAMFHVFHCVSRLHNCTSDFARSVLLIHPAASTLDRSQNFARGHLHVGIGDLSDILRHGSAQLQAHNSAAMELRIDYRYPQYYSISALSLASLTLTSQSVRPR